MKPKNKTLAILSISATALVCLLAAMGTNKAMAGIAAAERKNYYTSDYSTNEDLLNAGTPIRLAVEEEGYVLLKNEDNALPIPKGSKITVLGKNSNTSDSLVTTSLSAAGYQINSTMVSFYKDNNASGSGRGVAPTNGNVSAGYNTGETPRSMYTSTQIDSFSEYNDAAVVVIWRMSGEGNDAPRTMMWDGTQYAKWTSATTELVPGARNVDDHYLQLDQNEADLLALASENFDKVVVVFHTPSSFETGFLDDPGHYAYQPNLKAAIHIGKPIRNGSATLGRIMQGEVNPSGRLVDTWARDFKLDPTWQNFGNNLMEVDSAHKGNQYSNLPGSGGNGGGGYKNNYVTYNEGIYVGYRYWETRGYTEGDGIYNSAPNEIHGTTTTTWDNWYKAHVVYPYGHGLSYTTFEQEIVSISPSGGKISKDDEIELKVRVTNTGTMAGKDVVQVYYTVPYIAGGIEKSHVKLANFDKTHIIQPGNSEMLTIKFTVRDMASYDYNDLNNNAFKGYELDPGTYKVRLMKNAHEDYAVENFELENPVRYEVDTTTGYPIENRFDDVSNYITDDLHQVYLSRNDWEGTWPVMNFRLSANDRVIAGINEWNVVNGVQTRDPGLDVGQPYYSSTTPTMGNRQGIMLSELHGLDYNDPLWNSFLDQLTQKELTDLVCKGHYSGGVDIPDLGIKKVGNYDTRTGLYPRTSESHTRVGDIIILAQTWNRELSYKFGRQVGDEALWSVGEGYGSGAWYAPSVNIHRSQFLGRNQQYYGEDPVLAGKLATQIVIGSQEKGFPTYLKHFAVNNQETNRCGLITWLNEQAMREIYFPAFEIVVKEGKTLGIMSSLNRIGTEWAGGSYNLLTEVLRNEWGFKGSVVTDSYLGDKSNISCADHMIRGGGNLALGNATLLYNVNTPTTITCEREAVHGLLYLMAHSNAINAFPQGDYKIIEGFQNAVLNTAFTNVSYNTSIATARVNKEIVPDADDNDITYALTAGSSLPLGLSLSSDGVISGVPLEEATSFRFKVRASYQGNFAEATFTIDVVGGNGSILYSGESNLGEFEINKAVDIGVDSAEIIKKDLEPGEVLPSINYSLKTGSLMPEGLILRSDGKITGTPTKEVINYSFVVIASAEGYRPVEKRFTLSILFTTTFEGKTLPNGKIGESYSCDIGNATSYNEVTYSLGKDSELPKGLYLSPGGHITGIPTESVTNYKFRIVAEADFALPVEKEFTISIGLNYNPITTTPGRVGEEFYLSVDNAQGDGNITYTLAPGSSLPKGLTLSSDGIISGTPQESGDFYVVIIASADGKISDTLTIQLHFDAAPFNPLPLILSIGGGIIVLGGVTVLVIFIILKKKKNGGNTPKAPKEKKEEKHEETPKEKPVEEKSKKKEPEQPKVVKEKKPKTKRKGKGFVIGGSITMGLGIILAVATIVLTQNKFLYFTVCSVLGRSERYLVKGNKDDYQYYVSDYENKQEVFKAASKLNETICEEGFVLLKNEDNSLPIAKTSKVTVFGRNSTQLVLGGSGSNAGSSSNKNIDLYQSLENVGIQYNPTLKSYYESVGPSRPSVPAMGSILTGFPICETPLPYSANVKSSYSSYNDAAIVVLSRIGGEGYDLPRSMFWNKNNYTDWNGQDLIPGANSKSDHYLQLDKNEKDMLAEACANFDNVIVLLNSASPLELGFLKDPSDPSYNNKIKSCLWIGSPGSTGANAIGRILVGDVNPSGRTVDTYPKNFKNDPTWFNFGNNLEANANTYITNGKERKAYFVEYREGIYFGYRYYETKGYTSGESWYNDNVIYPFGYGLSYTDFTYNVTQNNNLTLNPNATLTFNVEVTNTGDFDGKDVVELYYEAPYKNGEIEKPKVVLGDFKKTDLISKNNGKKTVTLSLPVRSMASYDYNDLNNNGFKGYELDEGTYTIYIGKNAHSWADAECFKFEFSVPLGGYKYQNDEVTNTPISNLFDDVSNHINEYLSRNNDFANFDAIKGAFSIANRTVSDDFIASLSYSINDKSSDPWYSGTMPNQSKYEKSRQECQTRLYDLIGKDYDDPLWDTLLDQLTVTSMVDIISTGNFRTLELENIDKPGTLDADGPMGFAIFMGDNSVYDTCYYASETVMGSTWNVDLAYQMGKMVGNEGLIGNERGDGRPYSGWYAPAMNLHRSQFGGRNFEYYSEDGYLSGEMAKNVVKGAREKGVYTYAKHFALNEQETKRDETGLITWANEQAMREIYYVPFEACVKDGKTTALMSSFNRIGTTWAGGNYNLLTKLLREEWGFRGMVITDFNLKPYMNTDQMIRAGGDLNLSGRKAPTSTSSTTDVTNIRRAAKNVLYTIANSCAMNGSGAGVVWGYRLPLWQVLLTIGGIVPTVIGAGLIGVYVFIQIRSKRRIKKDEN